MTFLLFPFIASLLYVAATLFAMRTTELGIALYGHATEINIVYAARGLWSVLAVWLIGHWFKNSEQKLGAKVLGSRLVGALLLLVAIGMLLLNTQD